MPQRELVVEVYAVGREIWGWYVNQAGTLVAAHLDTLDDEEDEDAAT